MTMLAILYNGLYSEYSYKTKSLIEVYFNLKQFYVAVIIEILACRHDPDEEFDVAVSKISSTVGQKCQNCSMITYIRFSAISKIWSSRYYTR